MLLEKWISSAYCAFLDATKITLAPSNADVSAGETSRMQCSASHDSSLDITFIWSLNDHAIDFIKEEEYYQHSIVRASTQHITANSNSAWSVSDIPIWAAPNFNSFCPLLSFIFGNCPAGAWCLVFFAIDGGVLFVLFVFSGSQSYTDLNCC